MTIIDTIISGRVMRRTDVGLLALLFSETSIKISRQKIKPLYLIKHNKSELSQEDKILGSKVDGK